MHSTNFASIHIIRLKIALNEKQEKTNQRKIPACQIWDDDALDFRKERYEWNSLTLHREKTRILFVKCKN